MLIVDCATIVEEQAKLSQILIILSELDAETLLELHRITGLI